MPEIAQFIEYNNLNESLFMTGNWPSFIFILIPTFKLAVIDI